MNVYFQKTHQRAFGTYPLKGDVAHHAISTAVDVGYRAFDTAQMYANEADTGAALKSTGVAREAFCVTTKVHPDNYTEGRFLASVEQSLVDLDMDYVDVLLLHWPPVGGDVVAPLRLLQKAQETGLTQHVGVSNFTIAMLKQATETLDVPIVTNQVEFHPLLNQDTLMAGASALGVPLSAYCSVARGEVFQHAIFGQIGVSYGKSAAQVVLKWILQKGVSINTMSTKAENIRANFDVMDFELSHVDMARINAMTRTGRRLVTAAQVPWAPDWD